MGGVIGMISVVIPTLNEGTRLTALLTQLAAEPEPHEIIVVDGGSTDGTVAAARATGNAPIASKPGRGRQLARGATAAKGDIILFLHADSRFPVGGLGRIRETLAGDAAAVGGNFRLLFDGGTGFDRWLDGFYAWIRARGVYYGDSGIFVRRAVHDRIGGILPIALMEDCDFARRLERAGRTVCIADPPLVTSSRRFAGRRPVSIVIGWLRIHALYALGVSPERLARIYYGRPASFSDQSY